jgi:two-component system cell cycle response regulator
VGRRARRRAKMELESVPDDDYYRAGDADARTAIVNVADVQATGSVKDRHLLVQLEGAQIGQVAVLHGAEWRVGRHQDSDLWLRDTGVSRHHARFAWVVDGYVLEDLSSANGTYVGGKPVTQHRMHDGDIVQFGSSAVFRYSVADAQQEAMLRQLYSASVTDTLTGAYNREHFDSRLAAEISFARRHRTQLSLLLLDLDHFKRVNDTYGHQAGDSVLKEVGKVISVDLRAEDVFARYGGEEFAILLRGIARDDARSAAERFRSKIEALRVVCDQQAIAVTVSIGCAALSCCDERTAEQIIAVADRRLYAAKRGGRNRVVAAG